MNKRLSIILVWILTLCSYIGVKFAANFVVIAPDDWSFFAGTLAVCSIIFAAVISNWTIKNTFGGNKK